MQLSAEGERRACVRCDTSVRVTVQPLPPSTSATPLAVIHGSTQNFSSCGMCVLLNEPCEISSLLRCEVFLTDSSPSVPTLGYVRWTQSCDDSKSLTGVEFLL